MTRPFDWAPLAETDPLPGDPDAITVESARLSKLGEEMRTQAARLRQIGADTTLVGDYADSLRSASGELAQDLDKVAGRYERVGSALRDWAPELASAQAETLKERDKAKVAAEIRQRNTVITAVLPPGVEPTPEQITAIAAREAAFLDAEALLAEARRNLSKILDHAHARGRYYAGLIDDANDVFKDGRWDNFKDFVDRNAEWIDEATKVIGWVATGLAVVAIFIPGPNLLIAIGVLTFAMAGSHGVLAATGSGSWVDVGFDVFALLTLGAGVWAAKGVEAAQAAGRAVAASEAREKAFTAVMRSKEIEIAEATRTLGRRQASAASKAGAERRLAAFREEARQAGSDAAREVIHAPLPHAGFKEIVGSGDRVLASTRKDLLELAARHPNVPQLTEAVERGEDAFRIARSSYVGGMTADAYGKAEDVSRLGRATYKRVGSLL